MSEVPLESTLATTMDGERHSHLPLQQLMSERIHYGCGGNVLKGWLNVDGFDGSYPYQSIPEEKRERIVFIDLAGEHPFEANSFAFGFSEHMLEHLDQEESIIFLCEAFRTLKADGVLRLSFPGLAGVLRRHYRSSDFQGARAGREEAYTTWRHRHFYCFESLKLVAEHIGFREAREVVHGQSEYAALRGIESRSAQEDGFELLVELVK